MQCFLFCFADKSEYSSLPEYQNHSLNETAAAASAEGTTFYWDIFLIFPHCIP